MGANQNARKLLSTDLVNINDICNSLNNFFGLLLDKTDHMIQNRTMVIRRYPPSDLISVI